jgi:hypothetical protein
MFLKLVEIAKAMPVLRAWIPLGTDFPKSLPSCLFSYPHTDGQLTPRDLVEYPRFPEIETFVYSIQRLDRTDHQLL